MEHVKQTHSKLNLTSLQTNKQGSKVKDEPAVQELILTFDLLRNFMYRNDDVKVGMRWNKYKNEFKDHSVTFVSNVPRYVLFLTIEYQVTEDFQNDGPCKKYLNLSTRSAP